MICQIKKGISVVKVKKDVEGKPFARRNPYQAEPGGIIILSELEARRLCRKWPEYYGLMEDPILQPVDSKVEEVLLSAKERIERLEDSVVDLQRAKDKAKRLADENDKLKEKLSMKSPEPVTEPDSEPVKNVPVENTEQV